eukprot:9728102-Alexandrium_andersonii.AAC.1
MCIRDRRKAMFRDWSGSHHLSTAVGAFAHRKERATRQRAPSPTSAEFLAENPEVDEDSVGFFRGSPAVVRPR